MSKLIITVWDVQHGNAIYMRTPNGTNIMFDIGTGSYSNGKEFSPLKYLKIKYPQFKLDYLVISHPHADHISDIKHMFNENLKPTVLSLPKGIDENFIRSSNRKEDSELVDLYLELERNNTGSVPEDKNPQYPQNNGGVSIQIFSQREKGLSNLNNYSLVAVVSYNGHKILLPGDIEKIGWESLLENPQSKEAINGTTIFLAAHHGRESGYCKDIFNFFEPLVIVVSDGRFTKSNFVPRYYLHSQRTEVVHWKNGKKETRHVLTTRKDGPIYIEMNAYKDPYIKIY